MLMKQLRLQFIQLNKIPLKIDSSAFFFGTKIFCFEKTENKKKPNATIENLNARAAKGSL